MIVPNNMDCRFVLIFYLMIAWILVLKNTIEWLNSEKYFFDFTIFNFKLLLIRGFFIFQPSILLVIF